MVLIGEGPLFGVVSPPDPMKQHSFLPQIGLQRSDSLALSGNCLQPGITTIDLTNPSYSIAPFSVTTIAAGTLQPVTITTSAASVISRSGCVNILGGSEELLSPPSVRIFPNPTSGRFTFDHDLKGDVRMLISDIGGRKILELDKIPAGTGYTMDAPQPGMYIITVDDGKKKLSGRLAVVM